MKLEVWDDRNNRWIRREVEETKPVIEEIDKIEALGDVSVEYKRALIQIVDEITSISLNDLKSVRN